MSKAGPALLLALVLIASASKADPVARTDLVSVDVGSRPWSSVGRINNSAYGRCSAILVSPDTALTAAHCLYNARSRRFLQPASIHVLFGFDRGRYGFHATVRDIVVPERYRPADILASAPHDWAVLRLAKPVPDAFAPLALAAGPASPGTEIQAAGFAQERSEILTASTPCRVEGATFDGLLLADCRISHGFSGGPLIDLQTKELVAMGVAVATNAAGDATTLAIPAARLREALGGD
ncbi:hypothetical protein ASG43_02895 [Aureimonas sp. Leaf454]|uniref:trypsin-like serine peptidase n=1 Tax=Aureimonas sp. Leaf454 TaxID=1736381 RepID=UPI0006FC2265|nr:trypsin-like peptidase domain-containing protein [Aureimonas sp. Leaf454]KQT54554.1 hypothetical protein ASG43_02895 [Aureimonas sp. Leaf454]